jgi:anthranilate phosphoribosyltransferase
MATIDDHGGWPALLTHLLDRNHLTAEQAKVVMSTILAGDATPAQMIAFVVALRAKGESSDELAGLLDAVLEHGARVALSDAQREVAIDIVGTGGDRSHSINVSTMAALVCAGAGAVVCKHGNRAASSKCGSADVLEALGVVIALPPEGVLHCIEQAGIGFCLAQAFHPAFRFAAGPRREIGIATVFNLLGPMANPGRVRRHVIGVVITRSVVDPSDLGLAPAFDADLTGGDPAENAAFVRSVLDGTHGPHRDIVLLNAGAGLVVAGLAPALPDGVAMAAQSVDSGAAAAALDKLVAASQDAQ